MASVSFLSTMLISALVYLNPSNYGWWNSPEFSWTNVFQFIFIDQILIEYVSVWISLFLLKNYADLLKLDKVKTTARGIFQYQLLFSPIPLLAFFFFNPFTQTLRFLYHYWPQPDWAVYWENDKYVVRLTGGREFGMSRKRLKKIKDRLRTE